VVRVRNYQARNFMLNDMRIATSLFLHSSARPGIADRAGFVESFYPTHTVRRKSPYFDPDAKRESSPLVQRRCRIRAQDSSGQPRRAAQPPRLSKMRTLSAQQGFSITPVTPEEWAFITRQLEL